MSEKQKAFNKWQVHNKGSITRLDVWLAGAAWQEQQDRKEITLAVDQLSRLSTDYAILDSDTAVLREKIRGIYKMLVCYAENDHLHKKEGCRLCRSRMELLVLVGTGEGEKEGKGK